jgi:hypothetical protein
MEEVEADHQVKAIKNALTDKSIVELKNKLAEKIQALYEEKLKITRVSNELISKIAQRCSEDLEKVEQTIRELLALLKNENNYNDKQCETIQAILLSEIQPIQSTINEKIVKKIEKIIKHDSLEILPSNFQIVNAAPLEGKINWFFDENFEASNILNEHKRFIKEIKISNNREFTMACNL